MLTQHTNPAIKKIKKPTQHTLQDKQNLILLTKTQSNHSAHSSKLIQSKVMRKSHSGMSIANNQHVQQMERQNDQIRKKIESTSTKIKQVQNKNNFIASKFRKLKQDQSSKLQVQIRRLNLEDKNPDYSSDWGSILQCSSNNGKSESRLKLSDIRQKMNRIDLSCISKLVFQGPIKIKEK